MPVSNKLSIADTEILRQKEPELILYSKNSAQQEDMPYQEKSVKKTIRRSALEIKKAEQIEEDKRFLQEKEWEIPAFLRKVKFKS